MCKTHAVKTSFRISALAALLAASLVAASGATSGNSLTLSQQPDLINWIVGPAKANLGDSAQIDVPAGFRFATTLEAATVLRGMGNPAPETLAGLMMPVGGSYLVVFEYTPIGYVKASDRDEINAVAVLDALRDNLARKSASIASVKWQLEPKFDSLKNSLEWAIIAETGSRKTVNHVVRLLGREGVLDGIAVQPSQSTTVIPLKQLMAGVSFKPGYAYADFRKGDRVAKHSLADLISTENPSVTEENSPYRWAFIGGGAVFLLAGGGFFIRRRKARRALMRELRLGSARATTHGDGFLTALINKTASSPASALNGNGHAHGNGKVNGHGKVQRKRMFDYQRYYSDLMFQVSDRAYETDLQTTHRRQEKSVPAAAQVPEHPSSSANASLIESQKRLIEEQHRLIREQSKLIEEKSRLIQEKNQVLDKQSELFGNNSF
jgi:uncharacterized membrane-anchored protein